MATNDWESLRLGFSQLREECAIDPPMNLAGRLTAIWMALPTPGNWRLNYWNGKDGSGIAERFIWHAFEAAALLGFPGGRDEALSFWLERVRHDAPKQYVRLISITGSQGPDQVYSVEILDICGLSADYCRTCKADAIRARLTTVETGSGGLCQPSAPPSHISEVMPMPVEAAAAQPSRVVPTTSIAEGFTTETQTADANAPQGPSDSTHGIDGGAKPDLAELSELTKRKLAIEWEASLDRNHLTGAEIDRYASTSERVWRLAASKPPSRWNDSWNVSHESAKRESGTSQSVRVARERFMALTAEYWPLWEAGGAGYESYAGELDVIKRKVFAEIEATWKERSHAASRCFETACSRAVEGALGALVREQNSRARDVELRRVKNALGPPRLTTGNPILDEIYSGADNLSPLAQKTLAAVGLRREQVVPPAWWVNAAPAPTQSVDPSPVADNAQSLSNTAGDAPPPHLLANATPQEEVPEQKPIDQAPAAKEGRAKTVARIIRELDTLKPQMFEDEKEYNELRQRYPDFLAFKIAESRSDLKKKILGIRFSARHIRLAQELAAAHHGRELSTVQDDWKRHKPREFKRPQ